MICSAHANGSTWTSRKRKAPSRRRVSLLETSLSEEERQIIAEEGRKGGEREAGKRVLGSSVEETRRGGQTVQRGGERVIVCRGRKTEFLRGETTQRDETGR